jgi:hypothetical protein
MVERWGSRRLDEIEKEPPKEAPIHIPGDAIGATTDQPGDDDITPPEVAEDLGNMEETMEKGKYTEIVQDRYGKVARDNLTGDLYDADKQEALEKEGARLTAEGNAIEAWVTNTDDATKYLEDFESRLDNPPDTPSDVVDDTPSEIGADLGDSSDSD